MAGELELSVIIRAQDQASAALANVEKQFGGVAQRMTASAENVGVGMDRTSLRTLRFKNAVENSVASVVGQFNPALAGMFRVMDRVGDAGERAGASFVKWGVAIGATAAILGQYIATANKVAEEQAKLNLAVSRFDAGAIAGEVARAVEALELLRLKQQGFNWTLWLQQLTEIGAAIGLTTTPMQELNRALEAQAKVIPLQAWRDYQDILLADLALGKVLIRGDRERVFSLETLLTATHKLAVIEQDRTEAALERLRVEEQIALGPATEARKKATDPEAIRTTEEEITRIRRQFHNARILEVNKEDAELEEINRAHVKRMREIQEGGERVTGPVGSALPGDTEASGIVARFEDAFNRINDEGIALGRRLPAEILETMAQADVRAGQDALDRKIRDVVLQPFERLRDSEEFRRKLLEATAEFGTIAGQGMGEELQAGFSLGLDNLTKEFGTAGQNLARTTADIGRSMQRSMSDTFFAVVTGQFNSMADIAKRAGESILRSLTDALANVILKNTFGQIFGTGSSFGGIGAAFGPGGVGGAGGSFGAGDTIAVTTAGGQILQVPAALLGGGAGGGGAGGGFSFGSIPTPPLQSFLNLFSGASTAGGLAGLQAGAGFGVFLEGAGGLAASGSALNVGAGLTATGGSSLAGIGSVLGGAGAAIGLGLTLYSALTGPPTVQSALMNAASGAISGAVLGTMIYPGIGTVIGAIAGAIIGGVGSAFGKGGKGKKESQEDYAKRFGDIGGAANDAAVRDWLTKLQALTTFEALDRAFDSQAGTNPNALYGTGSVDGSSLTGGGAFGTSWWVDYAPNAKRVFDPDFDPDADIKTKHNFGFDTNLTGVGARDQATRDAIRAKIEELNVLSNVLFAFEEQLRVPGTAGKGGRPLSVTRQTILPFTRLTEGQGQNLAVLEETILGFDDDAKARILAELVRVDVDRDLRLIRVDPEPRLPITVGSWREPAPGEGGGGTGGSRPSWIVGGSGTQADPYRPRAGTSPFEDPGGLPGWYAHPGGPQYNYQWGG